MGAYTCEFGVVHKMCRCPKPHTVKCDKPWSHRPSIDSGIRVCIVWEMKKAGRLSMGKHEAHPAHEWWYITYGGGHQLNEEPKPDDPDYHRSTKWHCPGEEF